MPPYANPGSGEDNYSDAPATAPSTPDASKDNDADEEGGGETALLPKSLCPDMKPGDTIPVKVVRIHEDQYEVSYEPEKKEETEEPMAPEAPAGEGGEMESMMQ